MAQHKNRYSLKKTYIIYHKALRLKKWHMQYYLEQIGRYRGLAVCGAVTVGLFVQPLLPSPLHNTTGSFDVRADDGRAVGFFDVGADDGRAVGFFDVGADDGRVVGAGVGLVLVVGLIVGDAVYVIRIAGHSDGSGLIPVYALFTYLSRFVTLSYMLSQTTTPLESMT
jgi:hypothetical protein